MRAKHRGLASAAAGIVLLLSLQGSAANAAEQESLADAISLDLGNGAKLDLVLIRPGSFTMGDANGGNDEKPAHKVTIKKPFYMGKYEVTQKQWQAVMGGNPSRFKGPQNPVENVSWDDCQTFLQKLNEKLPASGAKFSLPTEAQWEYACRAGGTGKFCYGDAEGSLGEYAWFAGNSGSKTHPVGEKKPNAWGLYDMHGNVWEWCQDYFHSGYYAKSPADDPVGPSRPSSGCVLRGGSREQPARHCSSASRTSTSEGSLMDRLGFRVSRVSEKVSGTIIDTNL